MSYPLWYTICMTVERDREREAAQAAARVVRWNESVQRVREIAQRWRRENAHLYNRPSPYDEES